MNRTNLIRLMMTLSFLVMFAFPLSAQEKPDTVITFRFLAGRDMFFVPFKDNGEELARLFGYVDRYKERIIDHEIMLYVDGYSVSRSSYAANRIIAKIRSNRVKSELITRKGLKEDCFITHNHVEEGNFVTVRMVVFKSDILSMPEENPDKVQADTIVFEESRPIMEREVARDSAAVSGNDESAEFSGGQQVTISPADLPSAKSDGRIVLKTNTLGYAALMPNAEVEWMFKDRWSAALEVQSAWYAKEPSHKVYRLATAIPELRYWAVERERWHGTYVGLFGGVGLYDLSNGKKGHKGECAVAGLSAGYMWPIGRHLSLDAGVGVGYLRARDKVYLPFDGHFLYQFTKNINYVGPLRLKLSLVWRFQSVKNNR